MSQPEADGEITLLLQASAAGAEDTVTRLYKAVEGELRKLARALTAGHVGDHTLQTTVLVDEAFVRLAAAPGREWDGRAAFFRIASGTMRNILADHGRRRRPGGFADGNPPPVPDPRHPDPGDRAAGAELLPALAAALADLDAADPEAAAAFRLCFFGAVETAAAITPEQLATFTGERKPLAELAAVRGQPVSSVHRTLGRALAFLQVQLAGHR